MRTIDKEVKLKGEVVDVVTIDQLENEEDIAGYDLVKLLGLINRQLVTDTCNQARAAHRETAPGKGKRYNMAFNLLPTITFADGETGIDKLNACVTLEDPTKRKAALDALLLSDEVQAKVLKALAA